MINNKDFISRKVKNRCLNCNSIVEDDVEHCIICGYCEGCFI